MSKRLLLGIVLTTICCYPSNAQDTLTAHLINSIYKQVTSGQHYYYLFEKGRSLERGFNNKSIDFAKDLIRENAPKEIPFNEFTQNILADTATINWRNYQLINTRVTDKTHLPGGYCMSVVFKMMPIGTPDSIITKLEKPCEHVILVGAKASKRKIDDAIKSFEKRLSSKPREERECYEFSKPVFSNDKIYALLAVKNSSGGSTFVFKYDGVKWNDIFEFDRYSY